MAVEIRGPADETLSAIASAFDAYLTDHPDAAVTMYRHGPFSIRVRVIDPGFEAMSRVARSRRVWAYLTSLSEDRQADINMFLMRSPAEIKDSFANFEFENPVPPLSLREAPVD